MCRSPRRRSLPQRDQGFSALEAALAGSLLLFVMAGAVVITEAFQKSASAGRQTVRAVGRTAGGSRAFAEELLHSTILDPDADLVVLDAGGNRVADRDTQGNPVPAMGPVFRLTKNAHYRVRGGQVVYDRVTLEFRRDTADANGDGRRDQLVRILDPDGPAPRVTVLAERVESVSFRKYGPRVGIVVVTRGGPVALVRQGSRKVPVHRAVRVRQVARPRNF